MQCVRNKIELLEVTLHLNEIDVVCMQEHWLTNEEKNFININGFNLGAIYCRSDNKNGGVAIFYRQNINYIVKEIIINKIEPKEKIFEYCGIELVLDNQRTQVFSIYRSPASDVNIFLSELDNFLNHVCKNVKNKIILCGDLNIDFLSHSDSRNSLVDIVGAYNIDFIIDEPTRCTSNSSSSIDYICTNLNSEHYNLSCTIIENGVSDHMAQILTYDCPQSQKSYNFVYTRVFNDYSYNTFLNYLSRESWASIYNCQSVNEGFELFSNILKHYFQIAFPIKKLKNGNKSNKLWLTRGIIISSHKLKFLYKIMTQTRNEADKEYYKKYKKIYKEVILAAKKMQNEKTVLTAINKNKEIWKLIHNSVEKNQNTNIHEILSNGSLTKEPKLIADSFNDFFVNLPLKINAEHNLQENIIFNLTKNYPTMFIDPVTENDVYNTIMSLKNSNSVGIDELSSNLLKISVNYLVYPLTFLINYSLEEGIFPKIFKMAKVIPLHKKGDKLLIENYRPISLLCTLSKVLEKIIFNKITLFLNKHNILSNCQHGFRKGKNTHSAILQFIMNLYENLNNNKKCIGLFMDLSKAFDLVDHVLLSEKLFKYGLRGKIHKWLQSYLSNRKQIVEIAGVRSNVKDINIGVPQGSVLGPLLFLIFVNDLPCIDTHNNNLTMFADDNTYLMSGPSIDTAIESLQNIIDRFVKWFKTSRLHLNISKTVFINFTPRTNTINTSYLLKIDKKSIEQVDHSKFLGLYIDNMLNWEKHADALCKKISSLCFALHRLRNITNRSVVLTFYSAHILSRLRYGIIFWGNSSQFNRIFRMQKRTVRTIVGINSMQSCRSLFKELNILPLACIYILEILIFVKNNESQFVSNNDFHEYNTRHNQLLTVPAHNLTLYEKSPKYMGIKCFNKLPNDLKSINNINTFKKNIFDFLLERSFYTVSEYLNS